VHEEVHPDFAATCDRRRASPRRNRKALDRDHAIDARPPADRVGAITKASRGAGGVLDVFEEAAMAKRWWIPVIAAAVTLAASGCAGTYQQASVDASLSSPNGVVDGSYFYGALSPYGRWVECQPYGWCWTPYGAAGDWRPYGDGSWTYTDVGWSWVSDEPWGWACYHYGRWMDHPDYGWVWVPGNEWAPAWVAWPKRFGT